jgi:hypothetical protein
LRLISAQFQIIAVPGAGLALRYSALKFAIFERMVLDADAQSLLDRIS